MKLFKLTIIILCLTIKSYGQEAAEKINTKFGVKYITTQINYPISGTYQYKGAEPIVELKANGFGFYQLPEELKRPIIWGIECKDENAVPIFVKGFDTIKYTLFYKYTDSLETKEGENWNKVDLSVHLSSEKIYINGDRMKIFSPKEEKSTRK